MLTPLAPADEQADPFFKDAGSCARWLKQLQLTNLQLAHSLLLTQINELNRFGMREQARLDTLELLRDTVHHVQNDYAKKLIAKPLPLDESELIIFLAIVQLWQAMAHGYQRCLQDRMESGKQPGKQNALLCQRSLLYCGLAVCEHLRTGYECDPRLWLQLHGLYAFAEEAELQLKDIPDPMNGKLARSSCHDIYVKTLLTCYARPAELARSQLQLLDTWLAEWSNMVPIERSYIIGKGDGQPLALDLDSASGLQPAGSATHDNGMRYLIMSPLSKLLRVKTILLQQGQSPKKIKLEGNSSARKCIELLAYLHQCWCEDNTMRFGARIQVSQHAQLCFKPENIYARLSGKTYDQAARYSLSDNIARKQIEAFGRVLQNAPGKTRIDTEFPLETWQCENESILGAKLARADAHGERLNRNQLVGLYLGEAETLQLGATTWVTVALTGQLQIGVRYLPGKVQAISLRTSDRSAPGLLLQSVPALKSPASLVIPRNWFKPGCVVDIQHQNGETQNAKMGISVERGADYERVSFKLV